ncbi:WSC domain-containing protein 1-like, partial [Mercenaria mercenaria]|uniref:WSC domain-containing protein 1-like n=1 Tax=Mercenaria mercenaria TaxID=6596 RepID=UPI00234E8BD2
MLVLGQRKAVSGEYFELNTNYTWTEASSHCSLAKPPVNLAKSGYSVDINYELKYQEAWVGYFMMMTVFEYIGCASVNSTQPKALSKTTPGLCYTVCKTHTKQYIGLIDGKCYCLEDAPNGDVRHQECNHKCGNIGIACGNDGHMAVYKVNINDDKTIMSTLFINEENCKLMID